MISLLYTLLVITVFACLSLLQKGTRQDRIEALTVYGVLVALKLFFLYIWLYRQSGYFDLSYLQFPDEHYYVSYVPGIDRYTNFYSMVVWSLQQIGMDIFNVKVVNIALSSFAVVRFLSLKKYVADPERFALYTFLFLGIMFFAMTYYSVFVLKESILFYLTVEFSILLLTRHYGGKELKLLAVILLMMLFRKQMALLFALYVFDRNWRLNAGMLVLFSVAGLYILDHYGNYLHRFILRGYMHTMNVAFSDAVELAQMTFTAPAYYGELIMENLRTTVLFTAHKEFSVSVMLLIETLVLAYLFVLKKGYRYIILHWEIFALPLLYVTAGLLTFYNYRYNFLVVTLLTAFAIFFLTQNHMIKKALK